MSSIYRLRVQVIVTADDDGENAPLFSANSMLNRLPTLNAVFAPAAVEFVFDAVQDFQKINSTLLNRDFTPLERPNVGSDKWDHEPQVDSKRHSRARDARCDLYPNKLVLIVRERKALDKDGNGHWSIVGKSGSSSGANARYVNLSAFSEATDLAHEIGHYLQLPHTFVGGVENVADAAAKIKKYVEDGHPRADGLQALDGDRAVIGDTPADCKGSIFVSKGLDKCGPVGTIDIPVDFGDTVRTYHLTPDRNMVMSYF